MMYFKGDMQTIIQKLPGITYIGLSSAGKLQSDPKWLIKRIKNTGNTTVISFANNEILFNKKWTLRSLYNYEIS
jgi:hypothetical protein